MDVRGLRKMSGLDQDRGTLGLHSAAPVNACRRAALPRIARLMRTPATPAALLICGWSVLVFAADPFGAFPLNDDWSYSRAVRDLVLHGHLEFTAWTSMPLIAQVLWGALFCLPFGFSFVALRLSTAVLGGVGVVAIYLLLREVGAGVKLALLGAIVLALNPLFFSLSLSFMTDVPFCALSTVALLFFVRGLRTQARSDILIGYAAAAGAILIRQPGAIIPVAFAIVYAVSHRFDRRSLTYAILPASAELLLLFAYPAVLRHSIGLPALYITAHDSLRALSLAATRDWLRVVRTIGDRLLVETIYLGAFLLPLSIVTTSWSLRGIGERLRRGRLSIGLAAGTLLGGVLLAQHRVMPLSGNVLFDFGLGPPLLRDTYLLHLHHLPTAPQAGWLVLTAAGVLGGALIVARLCTALRADAAAPAEARTTRRQLLFVVLVSTTYLLGTAVTTSSPQYAFFDRYVVFAMAPLMVVLVCGARMGTQAARVPSVAAVAVLLAYGLFAIGATHDYLAWNRARWLAVDDLIRLGVSPQRIDGGFEVNAWYRYNPRRPLESLRSVWVRGDGYVIAFGPVRSYSAARRYRYARWMPPGRGTIVALRPHSAAPH